MKPLKDVFLFDMQDKASNLKSKMMGYRPELDDVPIEKLEEPLYTIRKRFSYPAKQAIIRDLGIFIKPIYNKDRIAIPSYLPAYLMVNPIRTTRPDDKVITVVNLTNYATYNREKTMLNMDPKQLFGLLQAGEILMTCYKKWNSITINQEINKLGSLIYSRMIVKILDKMYGINYDPVKADKVKFIASKFFLLNMLERSPEAESINNISYLNCTNRTTRATINQMDEEYNQNAYINFHNFIIQLSLYIDGLQGMTVRTFIDTALKTFGTSTILAFEYFPMFMFTISSVVIGARLNNELTLEPVIGKEADILYNNFVNFMRT